MNLQRPIYLDLAAPDISDPDRYAVNLGGLGAAVAGCGWITPFILGGVAMYAIPPLVGGFFSGAKAELADMRAERAVEERANRRRRR